MLEASIIVIGDELLGGFVTDANSPFLAERLREHGVPLSRVHVVPDEYDAIDEALRAELGRSRPRLILTSGGIGSTPDDITYEAVAATLGLGLVDDPVIGERIASSLAWSRSLGVDITDDHARYLGRMGRIPAGSRLLQAGRGWTPGVAVDVDGGSDAGGVTIVVLPGVPTELRSLTEDAIEPLLLDGRNDVPATVEIEHGFPESALNLLFALLLRRHPDVKLGSYPGDPMLIRLTGAPQAVTDADAFVRQGLADLAATPGGARLAEAWAERATAWRQRAAQRDAERQRDAATTADGAAPSRRLMFVHAHPDDEASKGAATAARYVDEGVEVSLVTLTDGMAGDVLNPSAPPVLPEEMAETRTRELEAAVAAIGFTRTYGLGYQDSGYHEDVADIPEGSFAIIGADEPARVLAGLLRRERPQVVVTYPEDGGYPHPDHIMCHTVTMRALELAADTAADLSGTPGGDEAPWRVAKVYASTIFPPSRLTALHQGMLELRGDSPFTEWLERRDDRPPAPEPQALVDVGDWFDRRDAALRAHVTQIDPDGFWFEVPRELERERYPYEGYLVLRSDVEVGVPEPDLFAGLDLEALDRSGGITDDG